MAEKPQINLIPDNAFTPDVKPPRGDAGLLSKLRNDANKRGKINQHWIDDKEARKAQDYIWLDNMNMTGGNQWAYFEPQTRRLTLQPSPFPNFPLLEADLLTGDVGILKSRLVIDWPIPNALPYGMNDPTGNSQNRASRWTTLYRELWPRIRDERFCTSMAHQLIVLGNVFRTIGWDPGAGRDTIKKPKLGMISVMTSRAFCRNCEEPYDLDDAADMMPEEQLTCPRCNLNQSTKIEPAPRDEEGVVGEEETPQGDLCLQMIPTYEIWKPAAAPSLDRCTHLHRHRFMDISWVYRATGSRIDAESGILAEDNWDMLIQEINSSVTSRSNRTSGVGHERYLKNSAGFHEYWELPGVDPDYPQGLYVQAHGKDLEPLAVYPYDVKSTLPFGMIHDKWEECPGRFYGRAHVEKLVPIQRWINALISTIAYDRRRLSHRLVLNKRGSGLKTEHLTGPAMLADLRSLDPKDTPKVMEMGGSDSKYMDELNTAVSLYDRVSNMQQILRGQAPPNTRTATGLNELREQAEAPIIAIVRNIYASEKLLAEEARRIIIDRYLPNRFILVSQTGDVKTAGFEAKELGVKDSPPEFQGEVDFRIDLDAAASLTRVEKINSIIALKNTFPYAINEADPQVMSRLMQLWRVPSELFAPSNQMQKERAEREMRKAIAGDPSEMVVTFGDDDPTHMSIHLNFLLSAEGMDLFKKKRQLYDQIWQHFLQHAQRNAQTRVQPGMMAGGNGAVATPGMAAGPQPVAMPTVG